MKLRKNISLIALIILALYNVIIFLIPSVKNTTFWVAYGFTNMSILITGLVALAAMEKQDIKKKFYNIPTVYISFLYVILQIITGFIEIYNPINYRYSILVNTVLLGIAIIVLAIINSGKKEIERVDEKVKEKVLFIKEAQTDVELFINKIDDENTKKELNLLTDTIKYSDPMSHSKLAYVENQINIKIKQMLQIENDNEAIKQICNELQQLFAERNKKAKLYKNEPDIGNEDQKPINFKIIISIIVIILVLIGLGITLYFTIIIPNKQYTNAIKLYENKNYLQAQDAFDKLGDYKDSQEKKTEVVYTYATELFDKKEYLNAVNEFNKIPDYKDSNAKIQEANYQYANELLENKKYTDSAEIFLKLNDYKDSKEKVIEIYNLFGESDVVYFGKYNGNPIAWQILETKEHQVLLISKDVIDEMAYNTEFKTVEWENSSIRKWLNDEFYNNFDENEKEKIILNSEDKIFLLSDRDFKNYKKIKNSNKSWWLVTNGDENTKAMYIKENGTIDSKGDVVIKLHGVRPVIWLNLD